MNVIATIRLIQVDGRNSSVELTAHNGRSQYVGTRKSYDPAVIEKAAELIRMFDWGKTTAFLEDSQPRYDIVFPSIEIL